MMKTLRIFLITLAILTSSASAASDIDKERRWADQIVDALIDGEPIWLEADDNKFLGIYTEAEGDATHQAMIVAHGIGVHPDWDQVVKPIRVDMPPRGWSTLSIQMPILPNEATGQDYWPLFDEVTPRIDAAIDHLASQGATTIVIAAHSMGGAMSAYYLANNPDSPVKGFIAVGMNAGQENAKVNAARSLEKISIPILDIYGGDDLPVVLETANARADAAKKAGNDHYQQTIVRDADHFFEANNEQLLEAIATWLNTLNK